MRKPSFSVQHYISLFLLIALFTGGVFYRSIEVLIAQAVNPSVVWTADGVAVSAATNSQLNPQISLDGSGGSIITWQDFRSGTSDVYAQRLNASGVAQWATDGVVVSAATGNQTAPQLVSDGSGGVIITWYDDRGGFNNIYAQKINSSGVAQWTANGVAISTVSATQLKPQVISDGSGGAIITWYDNRSSSNDIYAQRVNSSGAVQWTANGVVISAAANEQITPEIISDGSGGAIITWDDARAGRSIYAQRINSSGVVQWTVDGVGIRTGGFNQIVPRIVSDGAGGGIITWHDSASGNYDIYAQRVNSSGVIQWNASGVAITSAAGNQMYPQLTIDGSGGAIITWSDGNVYAQRINSSGVAQWLLNGVVISGATGTQNDSRIISDGFGGAIISWRDSRSGNYDIYAQNIDSSGVVQWTADGVAVITDASTQNSLQLSSDGSDGAIIIWSDARGGNDDIYAQSITTSVDLSGTCQQTIAGSNCVDDPTNVIKVAVNGVVQAQTDTVVDGSWSISGVEAGAGDVVSVFIDGSAEAEEAVAVTKIAGTGSLTGMELVYGYVSIGSANSSAVNNADLALYDNGVAGENIFFEVDGSNNLNTDVEGTFENGLYVTSLGTYTPEASVSITVHGDWITDGTFNEGTSAAVFDGSAAQSLDSGVALPANITHSGSGTLTLVGGALSVTTLNNNAGIIDLNGQNLTVATTFTNSGTIRLKGTEIITLAAQDVVNGTWEYVGDGTAGPFTVKDFGADDYNNLRIDDSAGGVYNISSALLTDDLYINGATVNQTAAITVTDPSTFTLDGGATYTQTAPMDITGNMEILNGTFTGSLTGDYIDVGGNFLLTAPSAFTSTDGELRVAGDFIHSGGTFNHGGGTVLLDGSSQAVSGSTSFYNFTKAAPGTDMITFADADVITVNGLLTLTGVIGELLTIQSEPVGGTQWEITHLGTESVSYINLKDGGCTGSTDITITNSTNTDLTSDACWVFPAVTPTDSVLGDVNIDITNSITLDISGPNPFGIAGVPLNPASGTTTTLVRAGDAIANPDGTVSTFTMKTNNSVGGSITVSGSVANGGELKSTTATIPNSGAGSSLSATCLAAESNAAYTGLAIRPIVSESDVSFVYDAVTSLADKFGLDTNDTTRLWCHATGAALTLAKTVGFNNPDSGTVLKIDYLLGVIAGSGVPVGNYSETLTFTATAN